MTSISNLEENKMSEVNKKDGKINAKPCSNSETSCCCTKISAGIKPDTPINIYTRFCLNTAKSKLSLVSPVAD